MADTKRVLIGEDSSVIQNLTRKILQFQNFDIISAKNGLEVMKKIEKEHFDVLLLDINMPKLDGMECARRIRSLADAQKANIPIIAITGNAKNYTMDDFKTVGINEYVPKPLNFDNLVHLVKQYTA